MYFLFFFSSRRRHTRYWRDWSSDVCSSDLDFLDQFKVSIDAAVGVDRDLELVEEVPTEETVHGCLLDVEIGRASCRERVEISVAAATVEERRSKKARAEQKRQTTTQSDIEL